MLYQIENGRIRPSKMLQDALASMLRGNEVSSCLTNRKSPSTIKETVEKAVKNREKYTIIIEGGPGTGKSVIAINLLFALSKYNVNYVTKNAAPRNVYFSLLRKEKYRLGFVKELFKSSGSFCDAEPNSFDCLLIDEAHRLNENPASSIRAKTRSRN